MTVAPRFSLGVEDRVAVVTGSFIDVSGGHSRHV
jgi:hypothetical protein